MNRLLFVDVETTGLDPAKNRIIELCAREVVDGIETGSKLHCHFNPGKGVEMEPGAADAHGRTLESLARFPEFSFMAPTILDYFRGAVIVAHFAQFDVAHINAEFGRSGIGRSGMVAPVRCPERHHTPSPLGVLGEVVVGYICTRAIATQRHPGMSHSLDSMLDHYGIDRSERAHGHGADLDTRLLWRLYQRMVLAA